MASANELAFQKGVVNFIFCSKDQDLLKAKF
mgnify:FL=1